MLGGAGGVGHHALQHRDVLQEPLLPRRRQAAERLRAVVLEPLPDLDETRLATEASGAQIVTVAIRRTNIGQNPGEPNLLDVLPPDRYTILPNTAGCFDAIEAVRTCRLARELLETTTQSVNQVARAVGLSSVDALQQQFRRELRSA